LDRGARAGSARSAADDSVRSLSRNGCGALRGQPQLNVDAPFAARVTHGAAGQMYRSAVSPPYRWMTLPQRRLPMAAGVVACYEMSRKRASDTPAQCVTARTAARGERDAVRI